MSEISKSWAIVQFKPNAHKLATHNLNQQNFETFLPSEKVSKYKNNKYTSILRPLFPGYMFVAIKKDQTPWSKIKSTFGVSKILTFNNQPYNISHELLSRIMSQCDSEGILLPPKKFVEGETVRIMSGAFNNFLATVDNIDKNKRIWVLIDLLGQETRASIKSEKLMHII